MKTGSLVAAIVTLLVANAFVLFHAHANRTGSADSELVLSERELTQIQMPNDDDSGVALRMQWVSPFRQQADFLDRNKLRSLGFNDNFEPQQPRRVYAAVEYAGPAWAAQAQRGDTLGQFNPDKLSQLVAIDAGLNPERLRAKYPDRSKVLVMAAVVGMSSGSPSKPNLYAWISPANNEIHVPRPFSDQIQKMGRSSPHFHVHLRFGKSFEPWVVGVEPL